MSEQPNVPEFNKEDFLAALFNPDVPFNYKFFFVGASLLYAIAPIDFIPDLLGPLGFADDIGVMMLGAQIFTHFANRALKEQHVEEHTQQEPDTIVVDAQAAPIKETAPAAQSQSEVQPRLPAAHLERHQAPKQNAAQPAPAKPPKKNAAQPAPPRQQTPIGADTSALNDEAHEQLINEKQSRSQDEFDQLMNRREQDTRERNEWDFSRNDPFAKKRNRRQSK